MTATRTARTLLALGLTAALALVSAGLGALALDLPTLGALVARWFGGQEGYTPQQAAVFEQIRLPRVVFALLCGGVLGYCGALLQGLFRNPLADPGLLGIPAGAALAVGILVVGFPGLRGALGPWALPLAALAGSLAATVAVGALGRRAGHDPVASLLLAGVAVNAVGGAGTGLLLSLARDAELRDLTFWALGSLGGVSWTTLGAAVPLLIVPFLAYPWMARSLDALLLGEREAASLGVPVSRVRGAVLVLTAAGVGASTALAGGVGFVGLVAPHLARYLVGPLHGAQLPMAALVGAALTVAADTAARIVLAPAEMPLGVVLALVGVPFLIRLLVGRRIES